METPILLILLYLLTNESNTNTEAALNPLHNVNNYLSTIEINQVYTKEKIKIAKKIGPLLPQEYAPAFNRSLLITEKVAKVMETMDFIKTSEVAPMTALDLEPKARLQKIVATVQDEVKSSQIENLGIVLDLLLNMDKYKKMLGAYTSLKNNKNPLSDTNSIMSLLDVFMDGGSDKDKEKIKDMTKMMDLMKILDSPKKDKPNES